METNIKCPKCDHQFNVENAVEKTLRNQIEAENKSRLNKELEKLNRKKELVNQEKLKLEKEQKSFDEKLSSAVKEREVALRSSIKKGIS